MNETLDGVLERVLQASFGLTREQEDACWLEFTVRRRQEEEAWSSFRAIMLDMSAKLHQAVAWTYWPMTAFPTSYERRTG
jgi:hypothetical protein